LAPCSYFADQFEGCEQALVAMMGHRSRKRLTLLRWGQGIFYNGWLPGYPKPGKERSRSYGQSHREMTRYSHKKGFRFKAW
jgi:hypothetical protein